MDSQSSIPQSRMHVMEKFWQKEFANINNDFHWLESNMGFLGESP